MSKQLCERCYGRLVRNWKYNGAVESFSMCLIGTCDLCGRNHFMVGLLDELRLPLNVKS